MTGASLNNDHSSETSVQAKQQSSHLLPFCFQIQINVLRQKAEAPAETQEIFDFCVRAKGDIDEVARFIPVLPAHGLGNVGGNR
jgi:hypothetical protein